MQHDRQMSVKQLSLLERMLYHHEREMVTQQLLDFAEGMKMLRPRPTLKQWDRDFLNNLYSRVKDGMKLSQKQVKALKRVLQRHKGVIAAIERQR